jgi:hypothetical protein
MAIQRAAACFGRVGCGPIRFPRRFAERLKHFGWAAKAFISAGATPIGLFSRRFLNKPRDGFTMQDNDGKGGRPDLRRDQRQDRLKLALRENLKRRKSQARGRDVAASSNVENPSPYDVDAGKPGK